MDRGSEVKLEACLYLPEMWRPPPCELRRFSAKLREVSGEPKEGDPSPDFKYLAINLIFGTV